MEVEVVMPKMGESIQEGTILRWAKKPGEKVAKDETILEISTDKVDSEIPSPVGGVLTKIIVPEQQTVTVGTVIAMIETDAAGAKTAPKVQEPRSDSVPAPKVAAPVRQEPVVAHRAETKDTRFYSPLVKTIAAKEGIGMQELQSIPGTGINGRLSKQDLLDYLKQRTGAPASSSAPKTEEPRRLDMKEMLRKYPAPRYEVRQMDNVQLRMAEHMVRSVHVSPHVGAISECDVSNIVKFRTVHADRFEQQEGMKLTYTPFFLYAASRALQEFPLVNASIEGDKIIIKNSIGLGMAVASAGGLIVPVIKDAEEKNFLGLARAANDLALRTRNKKLQPEDVQGGTFTITNYGIFGNIIGTPIINQPQVAILGIGAIKKRPTVLTDAEGNDGIAIRSMAYLTLSFDHRIVDGALGGQFLEQVVRNLEQFDFTNLF